jgi:hypothetical protein
MYSYTYRQHDARLGRFWSVDPLARKYPFYSPYAFSGNRLIDRVELEGLEPSRKPVEEYELQEASDARTGKLRWWIGINGEWFPSLLPVEIVEQVQIPHHRSQIEFAAYEFFYRFFRGLGPQEVIYTQGLAVEHMKTSPGVLRAIDTVIAMLRHDQMKPGNVYPFSYRFSPPNAWKRFLEDGEKVKDLFGEEGEKAHKDVSESNSLVKLFVGSYTGTITVIDDKTLEVVLYNGTTLNSLLFHRGTYLEYKGEMSEEEYNTRYLRRSEKFPIIVFREPFGGKPVVIKMPSFRPTEQVFKFRINIDEWK